MVGPDQPDRLADASGRTSGASACRLSLAALGRPADDATARALDRVQSEAMAAELLLSIVNERRLGPLAGGLYKGRTGKLFRAAKWAVRGGLGLQLVRRPAAHHLASALFLAAGLMFRYAWVGAGPPSARDDALVAETARTRRRG